MPVVWIAELQYSAIVCRAVWWTNASGLDSRTAVFCDRKPCSLVDKCQWFGYQNCSVLRSYVVQFGGQMPVVWISELQCSAIVSRAVWWTNVSGLDIRTAVFCDHMSCSLVDKCQ